MKKKIIDTFTLLLTQTSNLFPQTPSFGCALFITFSLLATIPLSAKAGGCGRADTLSDTLLVAKKIAAIATKNPAASGYINEAKMHIVDRKGLVVTTQNPQGQEIKTALVDFDAMGVISETPYENESRGYSYGSAIRVSPCHVITNAHVVKPKGNEVRELRDSTKGTVGYEMNFSGGQAANDSSNHFQDQNQKAHLLAIGADWKNGSSADDWAVLELENPSNGPFVPVLSAHKAGEPVPETNDVVYTLKDSSMILVGFPGNTSDADRDESGKSIGFTRARAMFLKESGMAANATNLHETTYSKTHSALEPGMSGGGVWKIGINKDFQPVVRLQGIHTGKGQFLDFATIKKEMEMSNPGLWTKIMKARQTGRCE